MNRYSMLLLIAGLLLAACTPLGGGAAATPVPVVVTVTVQAIAPEPTAAPPPAATDVPPPPAVSFEAATYRNEAAGFEFDYPAEWVPDEQVFGERGSGVQFTPPSDTSMSAVVLLWDPKNDLDAFVETRKEGWSASGATIIGEEELTLAGDRRAASFVVEGVDGVDAYFMFTTLGEDYLVVSGTGDLDLLAEIAGTVRPLSPGS